MNKYKLNFLRWITRSELPDEILKKTFNHKLEDDEFKFNIKLKVDASQWKGVYGTAKQNEFSIFIKFLDYSWFYLCILFFNSNRLLFIS